jgi:hypothetical protein
LLLESPSEEERDGFSASLEVVVVSDVAGIASLKFLMFVADGKVGILVTSPQLLNRVVGFTTKPSTNAVGLL